jgi:pilus assembly protein CpaE
MLTAAILRTSSLEDDTLIAALQDMEGVRIAADVQLDSGAETSIRQSRPNVLLVVLGGGSDPRVLERISALARAMPDTCTLFVGSQLNPEQLLAGMRAGVREFVTLPTTAQRLRDVLRTVTEAQPQRKCGKLIAFQGCGGGCGTSMLACNVAVEIVRSGRGSVCLVDLDLSTGQLAVMLDMPTRHSLLDLCNAGEDLDAQKISGALLKHDSGLKLLARPVEWCESDLPLLTRSVEVVSRLLEMFDYVVVDLDIHADVTEGALLSRVDEMVLVAQPVTPMIRNAAAVVRKLDQAGLDGQRLRLVLNRMPKRLGSVRQDRVEKSLKQSIFWEIPEDYEAVSEALNLGVPLADQDTYSKARCSVRDLAAALSQNADGPVAQRKSGGFLKRVFGTPSAA